MVFASPTTLVDSVQDVTDSTVSHIGSPLPETEQDIPASTDGVPRHTTLSSQQQTSQQQTSQQRHDLRQEPSTTHDKKQANRDHQKKFRERRKV